MSGGGAPWWQLAYGTDEHGAAVPQLGGEIIEPGAIIEIHVGGTAVPGILQYSPGQVAVLALQFSDPRGHHVGQNATLLLPRVGIYARPATRLDLPMYPPEAAPVPAALVVDEEPFPAELIEQLQGALVAATDHGTAAVVMEDGEHVPLTSALGQELGQETMDTLTEQEQIA